MTQYGIFGAVDKEPPQLTNARSILGVGRNTNQEEIKKIYRGRAVIWHPDKHHNQPTEKEAGHKMDLYTQAYKLLTGKREEAEHQFLDALRNPFLVGNRIFCLGSLYGVRIYIPNGIAAITDSSHLLTGEHSAPINPQIEKPVIYGIRNSILESELADQLEMFYGGKSDYKSLQKGFENNKAGGLDDLIWIKDNDLAVNHFLNRRFKQAAARMSYANESCPQNIIYMYRYGICLEAFAAQNKVQKEEWKGLVKTAIDLYEGCLLKLESRKVTEEIEYMGETRPLPIFKPESQLTILMQLADAYAELGHFRESKAAWAKAKKIDPDCQEAKEKGVNWLLSLPAAAGRALGLLK